MYHLILYLLGPKPPAEGQAFDVSNYVSNKAKVLDENGVIILPMPSNIQDSNSVSYDNEEEAFQPATDSCRNASGSTSSERFCLVFYYDEVEAFQPAADSCRNASGSSSSERFCLVSYYDEEEAFRQ